MTKKVKPAKKAKKPANKTPEITKAAKALENYLKENNLDVCAEVIRTYLKKPNRNLARLQDYAKRLRVFNTLKNYLEIAIE